MHPMLPYRCALIGMIIGVDEVQLEDAEDPKEIIELIVAKVHPVGISPGQKQQHNSVQEAKQLREELQALKPIALMRYAKDSAVEEELLDNANNQEEIIELIVRAKHPHATVRLTRELLPALPTAASTHQKNAPRCEVHWDLQEYEVGHPRIIEGYTASTYDALLEMMNQPEYLICPRTQIAADRWTRAGKESYSKTRHTTTYVFGCGLRKRYKCEAEMRFVLHEKWSCAQLPRAEPFKSHNHSTPKGKKLPIEMERVVVSLALDMTPRQIKFYFKRVCHHTLTWDEYMKVQNV